MKGRGLSHSALALLKEFKEMVSEPQQQSSSGCALIPSPSLFSAAHSHGKVWDVWHSCSGLSVSERFWCGSCFQELLHSVSWTLVLDINRIQHARSITGRLGATRCFNGFSCLCLPSSSLSISAARKMSIWACTGWWWCSWLRVITSSSWNPISKHAATVGLSPRGPQSVKGRGFCRMQAILTKYS